VRCRYLPGEASLAKAYLKATVFFEGAAPALSGFLPVPPESLGKDLRFEVPARPIRSLRVQIFSPGAFNPSPRSADLEWVRFVDVGGRP
jgi:hypothetical protein